MTQPICWRPSRAPMRLSSPWTVTASGTAITICSAISFAPSSSGATRSCAATTLSGRRVGVRCTEPLARCSTTRTRAATPPRPAGSLWGTGTSSQVAGRSRPSASGSTAAPTRRSNRTRTAVDRGHMGRRAARRCSPREAVRHCGRAQAARCRVCGRGDIAAVLTRHRPNCGRSRDGIHGLLRDAEFAYAAEKPASTRWLVGACRALGTANILLGRPQEAIDVFGEALALANHRPVARTRAGLLSRLHGLRGRRDRRSAQLDKMGRGKRSSSSKKRISTRSPKAPSPTPRER